MSFRMRFLSFVLLSGVAVACSTLAGETPLQKAANAVQSARQNAATMDSVQWADLDGTITALEKDMQNNPAQYTEALRDSANDVIGQYRAMVIEKEVGDFGRAIENEIDRAGEVIENIFKKDSVK